MHITVNGGTIIAENDYGSSSKGLAGNRIEINGGNIKGIFDYVTNPEKTNELLISGKDCTPETASIEMQVVKEQYNKTDGNTYFHIIQSFSPDDNLTPEKAHEVGVNFADYFKD